MNLVRLAIRLCSICFTAYFPILLNLLWLASFFSAKMKEVGWKCRIIIATFFFIVTVISSSNFMSQQVLHANKFNGFGFICIASEVSMQYQHTTQLSAVYNWQCDKGVSIIIYLFNVNEHVD